MRSDAFSKCHPLVNFIFFVGAIGFGVVIQHPAYIAVGVLCAGCYACLLSPRKGWKTVLGLVPVVLFVAAINPLFNHAGEKVLFFLFGNPYTVEALVHGLAVGGIFAVMMLWFFCYSAVLTSDKFMCRFGSLSPALSLLLTMVLRLIPNLAGKARQLLGARKSIGKGAGDASSKKEKLSDGMNILSALTDWALEGSIVTADSMRARGYGSAKRTSFRIYRFTLRDLVLLAAIFGLAAAILILGGTNAAYTPAFSADTPTWGLAAYGLLLLIPILLDGKEALAWRISRSKI